MQRLRDAMLGTVPEWERHRLAPAPREVLLALSCAGVAVTRRIALAHEGDSPTDLRRTAGLLLMLLVMATGDTTVPEDLRGTPDADSYDADGEHRGEEAGGFAQEVSDFESGTVEKTLDNASQTTRSIDWQFPNPKPSDICDSVVWLLNHYSINTNMEELEKWAPLFFRNSAAAAARGLLDSAGTGDFVAISSAHVLNETQHREERLSAVVSAADSEAGQTCLRDLQLSFQLPREVVGVRRTILLPREVNVAITKNHTAVLNEAHESALRGSDWEWKHSKRALTRACALLAGLAILLNEGDVRKDDAFGGFVRLPFLETLAPTGDGVRLALIEDTAEWVAFKGSTPEVLVRRPGFRGLEDCVLVLTSLLKR